MEALDYWHLTEAVSVVQASLLIVGEDPSVTQYQIDEWNVADRPKGYEAAISSLKNAVRSKTIPATVRHDARTFTTYDEYEIKLNQITARAKNETIRDLDRINAVAFKTEPNWHLTMIRVEDLKTWLLSRKSDKEFFFQNSHAIAPYLDHKHIKYTAKLAAAVSAWEAVSADDELINGKTVKKALDKWLREHAREFNLTKDDGSPNELGIEEVSKVANWSPQGGATRTPSKATPNSPTPPKTLKTGVSPQKRK